MVQCVIISNNYACFKKYISEICSPSKQIPFSLCNHNLFFDSPVTPTFQNNFSISKIFEYLFNNDQIRRNYLTKTDIAANGNIQVLKWIQAFFLTEQNPAIRIVKELKFLKLKTKRSYITFGFIANNSEILKNLYK